MDLRDDSPALFSTSSVLTLSLQEIPMTDHHVRLQSVSLHTVYSLCFSTIQQSSQHSSSVDLALHSYGKMAVISKPVSLLSIYCTSSMPSSQGEFPVKPCIVSYSAAKVFKCFALYWWLFVDGYSGG